MGSRQIGNYRIVDYVGSGGFGSVFKAEDVNSPGRFVAIKELHKKHTRSAVIKQRFFQEALAMARLDHPNLPRLYTFGEDNGSYYLVMEFVSGSPLGEEIARGSIVPDRAVAIISQVLEAVGYAHKNGVIHRDLKPDNILLTGDGDSLTVKVLDFGIAKLVGGENLTLTGEGFGTPSYMSPERIIGNAELDCRTDIYSLGIILCEMLTGNVPFQSSSTDPVLYWAEMRRMHESQPIPDVAPLGIPAGLDAVIKKAAAKRIQDRYATAEEMLAAISGQPTSAGLHLTTAPFSAEVFVDNVCRGISDEVKGRISIEGLTPGLHSVRVSKRGYSPYKIDVSLAPGQSIELQVQLPALSTVAIPRFETAEPGDVSTNRIQSGDEAKTALLTFENLPAGSTVSFEGAVVAAAGADGRATMALGAGTHELEFTPPSGTAEKRLVTVAGQDVGSVKTIAISPAATRQTNNAPMRVEQRQEPVVAIGLDKSKRTKKVAAASASVVIFASLVAAAFFVMRGPGKAPAHAAAVSQSPVATVSTETALSSASPAESVLPAATPSPDGSPATRQNDNAAVKETRPDKDSKDTQDKPDTKKDVGATKDNTNKDIASELPKPERKPGGAGTITSPPPVQPVDQGNPSVGQACLVVSVTWADGVARPGLRVACTDTSASYSSVLDGATNGNGRWRRCGLTIGHQVVVRVFGPAGALLGGRQTRLSAGSNFVSFQTGYNANSETPRPSKRPGVWRPPNQ